MRSPRSVPSDRRPASDFFERQDAARTRTHVLVALFIAAVIAIIGVVYIITDVALGAGNAVPEPLLLLIVAVGVSMVIGTGSAVRVASLRRGGPAVAELLGARRISLDSSDRDERKLINVVEEMSIAAGTPVPAMYVLDREDGINAFAAGYSTHDAAVAVTRGALRSLTRDELQGVVAHEFSHILNGDMRLNIRLIGLLYGILLLAVIGRGIVYVGPRGRRGRNGGWIVLVGLALLVVGYVGVFFGKLIKAAVSRQREYLADAAAVQFTRNPLGLAGALKKIGGQAHGSRIEDHHAEELSHLFFANGLKQPLAGFLSTHPPLPDRISRLDPEWDGSFDVVVEPGATAAPDEMRSGAAKGVASSSVASESLVGTVGSLTPEHLAYARGLLENLPDDLMQAAHRADDSAALLIALVAAGNPTFGRAERDVVRRYGGEALHEKVTALLPLVEERGAEGRLPLMDLALPAVQTLSPDEAAAFRDTMEQLVRADGQIRMFEYALVHTISRRLETRNVAHPVRREIQSYRQVSEEMRTVLSAVAWAGSGREGDPARAAYDEGRRILGDHVEVKPLMDSTALTLRDIDAALTTMERASGAIRRTFLQACASTAAHDNRLTPSEAELLRAISEALDCPMPPVLAS